MRIQSLLGVLTVLWYSVREINWDYIGDAVPAFLTIIIIPLSYNIAYGVIAGIISYVLINGLAWLLSRVSQGRLAPPNYDQSEPWVIPPGSIIPAWMCVVLPYLDLPYDFDPDTNTRRRFIAGRAVHLS